MKASELVDLLNKRYDPTTAEIWDRVGVVCGDLNNEVKKIYFCVDVLPETVSEAITWNADFIIAHHPLLLHELAEVLDGEPPIVIAPWKIALKERLISEGIVLLTAHTNAAKPRF
jgi:putative NIF3 family GTP cyclohydrolase 1 type 2